MTTTRRKAVLIGAAHYRRGSYGRNHPLAIPRVSLTFDVIKAYGALSDEEFRVSRAATARELARFHTREYIQALQRSEAFGHVRHEDRLRHAVGTLENPYFPGVFYTPALATGGSIQGAEEVLAGRHAFSPAGGMHHAVPDQARGFCYFNDVALAILTLREADRRVLYLDLDAHHGDGVEAAFWNDPAVFTVSLHMDTAYAYPFQGGGLQDQGGPQAPGSSFNVPLPKGTGDADYLAILRHILPAICGRFAPDVIVVQAGTDALHGDPLGRFRLSTTGFLTAIAEVIGVGLPVLVTGGGGYHPLLLARAWTGVWALLSGRTLPAALPDAAAQALRAVGWDADEDEPYYDNLFRSRLDHPDTDHISDWLPAFMRQLDGHVVLGRTSWVS